MEKQPKKSPMGVHWILPDILASSLRPGFPSLRASTSQINAWISVVKKRGCRSAIILLCEDEMPAYTIIQSL